jgi:PAS domain S-box-containing protein
MDGQRALLIEVAQSQARLLEAVARFDMRWSSDFPGGALDATLSQLRDANANYRGFGETGEFTLARRAGERIEFLLSHRHAGDQETASIPWDSPLAAPMRAALSGRSGILIGLDYRGERVLSAVEPIAPLGWGLVAKVDLSEIQRPFLHAAFTAVVSALVFAGIGAWLFVRLTNPLVRELTENEARFRALFQHSPLGIALVDSDGRPMLSNPTLQRLLGCDAETLESTAFTQFTHPEDVDKDWSQYRDLWAGRISSYQMDKRYLRADGTLVWASLTVSLMRDEHQRVLGAIGMVEDIGERRRMQQELTAAYERAVEIEKLSALGSFVGGIAHEIKNPLMGITNYISHVESQLKADDLRDYLSRAQTQVQRIDRIVDGVLHYASGSADEIARFSIATLVESVCDLLRIELSKENIRLEIDIADALPEPESSRAVVEQALLNLMLNAMHALSGREHARVRVSAQSDGKTIELAVADNGPGVAPALRNRIFEPFFTTKRQGIGTGLGLSVSQRNLSRLGARLFLDTNEQPGARFVLQLPIDSRSVTPMSAVGEHSGPEQRSRAGDPA